MMAMMVLISVHADDPKIFATRHMKLDHLVS